MMATIPLCYVEFSGNVSVPIGGEGHKIAARFHDFPQKPGDFELLLHTDPVMPWTVTVRQRLSGGELSPRVGVLVVQGGVTAFWPKDNVWPPRGAEAAPPKMQELPKRG